jgi:hypothetical protein
VPTSRFYYDGVRLVRVAWEGTLDSIDAMHEFAAAPTDVWVGSREAWQPWPPGAREILASGWFERVPEAQVPALQAELTAEAALNA